MYNLILVSRRYLDLKFTSPQSAFPPPPPLPPLLAESLELTVSVSPSELYRHLLAHCKVFGTQTLEMRPGSPSATQPDNLGLLIHVSPESLGPTTSPQLSQLLEEDHVSRA